jgi:hypothetical protein
MATMYENVCGNCVGGVDICLTVHSRAILKTVKSMCKGIKKNIVIPLKTKDSPLNRTLYYRGQNTLVVNVT